MIEGIKCKYCAGNSQFIDLSYTCSICATSFCKNCGCALMFRCVRCEKDVCAEHCDLRVVGVKNGSLVSDVLCDKCFRREDNNLRYFQPGDCYNTETEMRRRLQQVVLNAKVRLKK